MKKISTSALILVCIFTTLHSNAQTALEKLRDPTRESRPMASDSRPVTGMDSFAAGSPRGQLVSPLSPASSTSIETFVLRNRISILERKVELYEKRIAELEGVKK